MGVLLTFLFIIFVIFAFGLSIIRGILRFLFGFGTRSTSSSSQQSESAQRQTRQKVSNPSPKKKKLFDDNEGEYVEFEEIKEREEGE